MKTSKAEPERQCIVTREVAAKDALLRFVCSPSGELVFDPAEKLPGRGIWVTCNQMVLRKAMKSKGFSRAAKEAVRVPEGLDQLVASMLYQRALQALSLARKSGDVAAGHEKVASALASGRAVALLHASDASTEGRKKLPTPPDCLVSDAFSRDDLCQITGRENVAHLAVTDGHGGKYFAASLRRFTGFMEEAPL